MRGLCNGLGPAVYGFIFYLFHVDLSEDITESIPPNIHGFIHAANGTLLIPEEPRVSFINSIISLQTFNILHIIKLADMHFQWHQDKIPS